MRHTELDDLAYFVDVCTETRPFVSRR